MKCIKQSARLYSKRLYSSSNDRHLRALFDEPFKASKLANANTSVKGLFGFKQFSNPSSLKPLAENTVKRCSAIVNRICNLQDQFAQNGTSAEDALLLTAKQFDRLSDLLCSVIDPCEFIRNVHPNEKWIMAANEVYEYMFNYMNILNTHTGLYESLATTLAPFQNQPVPEHLFAAQQVSLQFLRDFEKSGISLPEDKRKQFVQLSDAAIILGREFMQPSSFDPSQGFHISAREAAAVGNTFTHGLVKASDSYFVPAHSDEAQYLVQKHPSEQVRKRAWLAINASNRDDVQVLEQLLAVRAATAQLLGRPSWAHLTLEDKMAGSPDSVMTFLQTLSEHNAPILEKETAMLTNAKKSFRATTSNDIDVWDREFYMSKSYAVSPMPSGYQDFFSVGTVIRGISRLCSSLYGISFQPVDVADDEVLWDPSVRKIEVVDERHGKIGHIYFDLYDRIGKQPGAAHYTVRCARRTDDDDADVDAAFFDGPLPTYDDLVTPGREKKSGQEGTRQLPIVVLTCNFDRRFGQVSTLSWHQVVTLFHEMGHAIHSMLGQADYQNVSGTRCATDFVELPSILMEHFCASPDVLALYARHHTTDASLPADFLKSAKQNSFPGAEQAYQITLAMLDQLYHSEAPLQPGFNSTEVWYDTYEQFGVGSGLRGSDTAWQTRFTHLVGYGATYYSYLLDRAIASHVWQNVFSQSGGLSRDAGERYKNEVLRWGGGKNPWHCLASLLQDASIAEGGSKAMQQVGHWGIS